MTNVNTIKAGQYELVAHQWDEITSKPGEPLNFLRHRRGDVIDLNVENARRLVLAGAVRKPGDETAAETVDGPSEPPKDPSGTRRTSTPASGSASSPEVPVAEDPTKHKIDAVKEYVGDDPTRAAATLELEQASEKPRSTLVEWLEGIATAPAGDETAAETVDGPEQS